MTTMLLPRDPLLQPFFSPYSRQMKSPMQRRTTWVSQDHQRALPKLCGLILRAMRDPASSCRSDDVVLDRGLQNGPLNPGASRACRCASLPSPTPALANQLDAECAASAFTAEGTLSEEALAGSREIIPSSQIGNLEILSDFRKEPLPQRVQSHRL